MTSIDKHCTRLTDLVNLGISLQSCCRDLNLGVLWSEFEYTSIRYGMIVERLEAVVHNDRGPLSSNSIFLSQFVVRSL